MDKAFQPQQWEAQLYKEWEDKKLFHADATSSKPPFTIILPPPNANADLHLGHAMYVYEDIMIRYHAAQGYEALWLPGADHAGFETQFVFEKHLKKQGKSRFDYDQETLYKMIWDFVQENRGTMENQFRRLGFALDWDRMKFTLDEDGVAIVKDTFVKMYKDGLIYRDMRLVNYCTHCGTGFSDLEVKHIEQIDPLYYLKYGPFVLATVRPETKFGDTAVAVHPKDKRYMQYVGQEIEVEGLNGQFRLRVIADEMVDPEFGTGVVKITPAHDFNDFDTAKRHNLEFKQVIGLDGKLTELAGPYAGMRVGRAREAVVAELEKKGLMDHVDREYTHMVASCYKCNRILEPMLMPQWYVKVRPLADRALAAIEKKEVQFNTAQFKKRAVDWLTNFHDWNISRQIVWGIRIPAYCCVSSELQVASSELEPTNPQTLKPSNSQTHQSANPPTSLDKWFVSATPPTKCAICGECAFVQDTDTFDTWFSSGQWPFTTLMTTGKGDFEKFYPTSVMETGYDILPWWVCRMLMLGLYCTDKVPFKYVYLHGLVRDMKGAKMSKSKGNVINPLEMADKYGADALRAALVFEVGNGVDQRLSDDKVRAMRNFANKIWNIGRFLHMNEQLRIANCELRKEQPETSSQHQSAQKDEFDALEKTKNQKLKTLHEEFSALKLKHEEYMKDYQLSYAFGDLYEFIWHRFADYYIETLKEELKNGNIEVYSALESVYIETLRMLHPFIPFVTDAVHSQFGYGHVLEYKQQTSSS